MHAWQRDLLLPHAQCRRLPPVRFPAAPVSCQRFAGGHRCCPLCQPSSLQQSTAPLCSRMLLCGAAPCWVLIGPHMSRAHLGDKVWNEHSRTARSPRIVVVRTCGLAASP